MSMAVPAIAVVSIYKCFNLKSKNNFYIILKVINIYFRHFVIIPTPEDNPSAYENIRTHLAVRMKGLTINL